MRSTVCVLSSVLMTLVLALPAVAAERDFLPGGGPSPAAPNCTDCDMDGFDSIGSGGTDCNDSNPSVNPDAVETCDGFDQDCDGMIDEGFDVDGDTFTTCENDCNDMIDTIYLGAPEVTADGIDQDCDGGDTCFADADDDGFGSMTTVESPDLDCDDAGEAAAGGDCGPMDPNVFPGAGEICGNGLDEDCDTLDEMTGGTRHVAEGGSDTGNDCKTVGTPCGTIGRAHEVACPIGDTIDVGEGTYSEAVYVTKSVTLLGEQAGVDARTRGMGVFLESIVTHPGGALQICGNNVTVDGFKIQGTTGLPYNAGIWTSGTCAGVGGITIVNNIFEDNTIGLYPNDPGTNPVVIRFNLFNDNDNPGASGGTGIYTDAGLHNALIESNKFVNNPNSAILLAATGPGTNSNITVRDNEADTSFVVLGTSSSSIERNRITGTPGSSIFLGGAVSGLNIEENEITAGDARGIRVTTLFLAVPNDGVIVFNNKLEGQALVEIAVDPAAHTGCLDASGNWFGTNDPDDVAAEIDAVDGNVDFSPWLDASTDTDLVTTGFQGDFATLWVDDAGDQCAAVGRIQEGIDLVTASTVHIAPGIYRENVVANKSVTLDGAGEALTTIMPADSNPNPNCGGAGCAGGSFCTGFSDSSNVISVEASDVTIEDLTVDGDNDLIMSGVTAGGADIDARNGIIENFNVAPFIFDNTSVRNVTVKNIWLRGIYASSGGTGFEFDDNTVDNVRGDDDCGAIALFNFGGSGTFSDNTVTNSFDGVSANWSAGTEFLRNEVECDPAMTGLGTGGIHTDNAGGFGTPGADLIDDNHVLDCDFGMFVFVPYVSPTVSNNEIDDTGVALALFGGGVPPVNSLFASNDLEGGDVGFLLTTEFFFGVDDAVATLNGNTITGFDVGVQIEEAAGDVTHSNTLTGAGNSITANDTGVLVGANVDSGSVVLDENRIYENTTAGFTNDGSIVASSICTWWGTPAGPDPEPMGGNSVTRAGAVDYMPWAANFALMDVPFWPDSDGDGFGDEDAMAVEQCGPPFADHVTNNLDCDDMAMDVNPDAIEVCDGMVDNDCDGSPNNAPADADCDDMQACTSDACNGSGVCEYDGTCDIEGFVTYYRDLDGDEPSDPPKPVSDVVINRTSDVDPPASSTTDEFGAYDVGPSGGDVCLTPKTLDATEHECDTFIAANDASLIAQHAVELITLSANQLIVADVSDNGLVTSFDASRVAQKSVAFPCLTGLTFEVAASTGSDWAFFPGEHCFTPLLGTGESYDFLAALYGDVNGSWTMHDELSQAASVGEPDLPEPAAGNLTFEPAPPAAPVVTEASTVLDSPRTLVYLAAARRDGAAVDYVLGLQAADGILGLDLVLGYDPSEVTVESVSATGIAAAMNVVSHDADATVRAALYDVAPLEGTGDFLIVRVVPHGVLPAGLVPFKISAMANEGRIPVVLDPALVTPERPATPTPLGSAPGGPSPASSWAEHTESLGICFSNVDPRPAGGTRRC